MVIDDWAASAISAGRPYGDGAGGRELITPWLWIP